jgi:hypothetical protein
MNEQVKFARWVLIHTDEVNHTAGVCRRFKNKQYTIDEIFDIYTNIQSKSENVELTPHIEYWDNGNVWVKGKLNSVGQREGIWEYFYSNGNIKCRTPYAGGAEDGIAEVFYKNGNIRERMPFKAGKMDGIEEWFYPKGKIRRRTPYVGGLIDGVDEWFYPNGNTRFKTTFKDGNMDGIQEWFDGQGNITETRHWNDGELIEETKH